MLKMVYHCSFNDVLHSLSLASIFAVCDKGYLWHNFCMFCTTLLYPFLAFTFSPLHLLAPSAAMLDQFEICDTHTEKLFGFK